MKIHDFQEMLARDLALEREGLEAVVDARPEGPAIVGKHQARNYTHLKAVIAEADEACPRAAETIRWLIWHSVLDLVRMKQIADDLEEDKS
ncbi:hypothetical protein [Salipiger mucosus]|uniref:hypothetical protein n=1 Tax=Salipiger mucosus TaxID=263378 RepID=UPI00037F3F64|nr:hypothetical protein [Salipiger mucosus]